MFTTPLLKPFDEPGNTLFNPNLRPPTVITAHGPDVGKTGFDITGLTRKKIADRLAMRKRKVTKPDWETQEPMHAHL